MAARFPGHDLRGPFTYGAVYGLLKRSPTELDRQQHVHQALYLRSVKQRMANQAPSTDFQKLQELERRLLLDDDDDDVSVDLSVVTATERSDAIQTTTTSSSSSGSSCSPASSKQLLLETAVVISEGNYETATTNIAVLKKSANPRGDPNQRLTAMMTYALISRLNSPAVNLTSTFSDLCTLEHQTSIQKLYDSSPCFKFSLMTANLAILDACKDNSKIHIVDFDLGQGGQYVSLIKTIVEKSHHRSIKITAVCEPTFPFNTTSTVNNLRAIGNKITRLAERFNVKLQFNVLNRRTKEIDRTALGCEPGEALAVNFAFALSRIADESVSPSNPRDELLRRVKSLDPIVVTIVEQEMNANTAPFAARFREACNYYGSVLDSLDTSFGRDDPDRIRIESGLTRKAANLIAREGEDRVERLEVFGKWRARLSMAGFKPVPFSSGVVEPVKLRFGSIQSNPGFICKAEAGSIRFGWMDRLLTVASAWR